jgi:hypothetical protein
MPVLTFDNADQVLEQCGIKRRVVGNKEETEKEVLRLWDIANPLMEELFKVLDRGADLQEQHTPEAERELAELEKANTDLLIKTRNALRSIAEITGLEPFMKAASTPGNKELGAMTLALVMGAKVGMPMSKNSPEGQAYLRNEELSGLRKKRKLDD